MRTTSHLNRVAFFFITCLFALSSCSSRAQLYVRSYSFDRKSLASYIVDTPDPEKENPQYGVRLNIEWSIPFAQYEKGNTDLVIHIKLNNRELREETVALDTMSGRYLFALSGDDYKKSKGIQSYFIELRSKGETIATSTHKLWVKNITVGEE
jgi:hypothetical protein